MKKHLLKIRSIFYFLLINLGVVFVLENLVLFKLIKNLLNEPEILTHLTFFFLFSFFFFLFLLFILNLFFQQRIFQPIKKIKYAIQEVVKKNFEVGIKNDFQDEIGDLIESFNQMVKDFKKTYENLEESQKTLEIRIAARTKEWQMLAENLEKEVEKRTKELQEKINELEKFKKLVIGRELKMIELKKEIKELKTKIKKEN